VAGSAVGGTQAAAAVAVARAARSDDRDPARAPDSERSADAGRVATRAGAGAGVHLAAHADQAIIRV
jgi:hypothetical protein